MEDKELFESLSYHVKHANEGFCEELKNEAYEYCEGYKDFLSLAKTEREACALSEEIAKENGFVPLSSKEELKPGDKVYAINNKKGDFARSNRNGRHRRRRKPRRGAPLTRRAST